MKMFESILNEFESAILATPTYDVETLKAVRKMLTDYEQGILTGSIDKDQLVSYEETIQNYIDSLSSHADIEKDKDFCDICSYAVGVGAIESHPTVSHIILVLESWGQTEPEVNQTFKSAVRFIDSGVDARQALERAIDFASKKYGKDRTQFTYRFKDKVIDVLKRLYPSMVFESQLNESATPVGGEIADKKNFNPSDPDVYVYGYGVLSYSRIKDKVARDLASLSKRVEKGDIGNASYILEQGIISSMLQALIAVDKELETPTMKRRRTMLMKKQQEQDNQ